MKPKELSRLARLVPATKQAPKLARIDLSPEMRKRDYRTRKDELQSQLLALQLELKTRMIPVVILIEGWDAAGKGGAIHRLVNKFDPRSYSIHPISAPTQEELDHHYLWRFWRCLPGRGRVALFDRSWYGRVLVERIEGFASVPAWRRAYEEINQFEKLLTDDGCVVIKMFMHISKIEQKQRFDQRAINPLKSWKMSQEDYRNRRKWDQYEVAIDEMFTRTHTRFAPWQVVAANDKRWARISVQEICATRFAQALQRER